MGQTGRTGASRADSPQAVLTPARGGAAGRSQPAEREHPAVPRQRHRPAQQRQLQVRQHPDVQRRGQPGRHGRYPGEFRIGIHLPGHRGRQRDHRRLELHRPVGHALADDMYDVKAVDSVGSMNTITITIDTMAPGAPVITSVTDDTGSSSSDLITTDSTPVITGTAEAGSLSTIKQGTTEIGTTTAGDSGDWTFDRSGGPALDDGTYTATATDAADNESEASAEQVVIDTTAPDAP